MRFTLLLFTVFALAACNGPMPANHQGDLARFPPAAPAQVDGNLFPEAQPNPVHVAAETPVSTFSIDVDTVSYAHTRRTLREGALPRHDAVRVEEMMNYFSYAYPRPKSAQVPFRPTVALYPTPWNEHTMLMHIGLKGYQVTPRKRPRANLVFLVDVSGSMQGRDRLDLLKQGFRLLVDRLAPRDTVSIVAYAGYSGMVLEPTRAANKTKILAALNGLGAGGSTAGAQGIRLAYALAERAFDENGVNRVILATDGDFNVGVSDPDQLQQLIETKRKSGIYLSVLGFGQGNYNDKIMQALAQNGNGNAAYIDTLLEARKVLVEEAVSTLFPIANDVKIQVEFNPAMIAEYRLIGYETRALKREDFNNDAVDAGDIGSGHTVTAIYEVTPTGASRRYIDELRYPSPAIKPDPGSKTEYAYLKLRYKLPGASDSKRLTMAITAAHVHDSMAEISPDMRFAASVASFGQKLRGSDYLNAMTYDAIRKLAVSGRGADANGYRAEFINLIALAEAMAERVVAARQ